MGRFRAVAGVVFAGALAVACVGDLATDATHRQEQARDAASIYPKFTGTWLTPDGQPAATEESFQILASRGPAHCGWQSVVFLRVAWPLGSELNRLVGDNDARPFVRDPDGHVDEQLAAATDLNASLPDGAQFTGYRTEQAELWLGPDEGEDVVYLVVDGRAERWPRAEPHLTYCA